MNILPLVFTVLLVLALFTNMQLDNFLRFSVIKKEYEAYMADRDHERFNRRQADLYHAGSSASGKNSIKSAFSNRRLNFRLILDRDAKKNNNSYYLQHRILLKELMQNLYGGSEFYKNIALNRPAFLDELLDRFSEVTDLATIKSVQGIDRIDLGDAELQFAFYNMLKHSAPSPASAANPQKREIDPLIQDDVSDEEEPEENPEEEYRSETGYKSLKDFLHIRQNQQKIRMYSAPRDILIAVFQNPGIADQFIDAREAVYRGKTEPAEAKLLLEKFKDKIRPDIKEEVTDFTVTKSNPKQYR